jgi:hypothetical protein
MHGSVRVERVLVGGQEFVPPQPGVLAAGFAGQLLRS